MINSNKWTGINKRKIEFDTLWFVGMAIFWPILAAIVIALVLTGYENSYLLGLTGLLVASLPGFCLSVHALITFY